MEKFFDNKITISTKGFSQTGKNSTLKNIEYKYKTILLNKKPPHYRRIAFYPIKKDVSDLTLTNRQFIEEIYPYRSLNNIRKIQIESKFKLNPLIKKKLFDGEINNYQLKKNKSFNKSKFRNKMNESVQSDIYYDEENQKKTINHQNSVISYLLNQKMNIKRKPKLKKINLEKIKIMEKIKNFYVNGIFLEKFYKKFSQNSKPVQYYFKEKSNKSNSNSSHKRKISLNMRIANNYLKNKNIYEIVEFGNRKEKVATKLIIDENENKFDNFDYHLLMKYPLNSKNNSIYSSNYSNILNNNSLLKSKNKMKSVKNKEEIKNIKYEDIKLLSQKGFEKMVKDRNKNFTKAIRETIENVKSNRKKYDSLVDINLKIYNKNKDDVLNNEL